MAGALMLTILSMEDSDIGMRKHGKFIYKVVVFLCLLSIVAFRVNQTLVPKYLFKEEFALTETYSGFYKLEQNSVSVLFLGSSHSGAAFNPQDLYDEYKITSYNLSSPKQTVWESYYWLKETLQYQSPQVVVLDSYMLCRELNQLESRTRMALDNMRLGSVKLEAIDTACTFDESQNRISYLLPNIRYHERWSKLNETDFNWREDVIPPSKLKGFFLHMDKCGYADYVPFEAGESEIEYFCSADKIYLDKIVQLCRENNIDLILVKSPTLYQTLERHNAVAEYADLNNLKFFDFNEKTLYEKIGFDYSEDMCDNSVTGDMNAHANPAGARKMTYFLGDILLSDYGIEAVTNWQWEETKEFNQHMWKDFQLHNEINIEKYLSMLDDDSYTIFITVKDEASKSLNKSLQEALSNLELTADWSDAFHNSYYAVIENGQVMVEEMSNQKLDHSGSFRDGEVIYSLASAGFTNGNDCSIKINYSENAKRRRGLNIVVYDNELKCVIDSVCFDTHSEELTASR